LNSHNLRISNLFEIVKNFNPIRRCKFIHLINILTFHLKCMLKLYFNKLSSIRRILNIILNHHLSQKFKRIVRYEKSYNVDGGNAV